MAMGAFYHYILYCWDSVRLSRIFAGRKKGWKRRGKEGQKKIIWRQGKGSSKMFHSTNDIVGYGVNEQVPVTCVYLILKNRLQLQRRKY